MKKPIIGFVQAPNYDNKVVVVKAPVKKSFVPKEGYTGKNSCNIRAGLYLFFFTICITHMFCFGNSLSNLKYIL
jgi:hypothetical protein